MSTFWITFRIADKTVGGKDYQTRYEELMETIYSFANTYWDEPTSFLVFETSDDINTIITSCKKVISVTNDLVLIREMDTKNARICGKVEDDEIFKLMTYLKKV